MTDPKFYTRPRKLKTMDTHTLEGFQTFRPCVSGLGRGKVKRAQMIFVGIITAVSIVLVLHTLTF